MMTQQHDIESGGVPGTGSATGMSAVANPPGETYPLNFDYETMEKIPSKHHNVVLAAIHGMTPEKIALACEYQLRQVKKILNHRPVVAYRDAINCGWESNPSSTCFFN